MYRKNSTVSVSAIAAAALLILSGVSVSNGQSGTISASQSKRQITDHDSKVTICHATRSATNPYEMVTVSDNGRAHAGHGNDINPAPATGCPAGEGPAPTASPEPVTMLLFGAGMSGIAYA